MTEPDTLAARIKRARAAADLTQVDLAVAAGISVSTVQRLEAGNDCTSSNLLAIGRVLDLTPNDLLGVA